VAFLIGCPISERLLTVACVLTFWEMLITAASSKLRRTDLAHYPLNQIISRRDALSL